MPAVKSPNDATVLRDCIAGPSEQASSVLFVRECLDQGTPGEPAGLNVVSLPYDRRQRSRLRVTIDSGPLAGTSAGIDLPRGTVLRDNTVLLDDADNELMVRAAPEDLIEVQAPDAATLTRLAYHLGNRHVPVQIAGNTLRLPPDHVLKHMIEGLGGIVTVTRGPFDPEAGAYAGTHSHGHHHHHGDQDMSRDVNHAPRIHDLSGPDQD